jgi:Sec-independent protein secretion pathway component TatC
MTRRPVRPAVPSDLRSGVGLGRRPRSPLGAVVAARAGLVPRFTAAGQRGLCVLEPVAFAATYSPTDLPSFALVALPPAVGLGVGVAWLEYRGRVRSPG